MDLGIGELFPRERAVLDVYDSVGKSEQPRIMGYHQNGAASLLGDRMENRHDCLAIGGIERGGRLVGENSGRLRHDGARDRDPLLEAAVEVQNDARQHAVARADRAFRLHRHRRKALAPLRARQQSTSRTERNDDDLAAALRDHLSRRLLFFAFATDLPPRKILELAKARLQQIDAMAGLFERRTRGVQHEALCLPLRQRCDTRIEILGNANRQAAAGDDIIRLRRRPRKLVEAAFLIRC